MVGISELVSLSPRVDPVFNDLLNNIKKNDDSALRNTMLQVCSSSVCISTYSLSSGTVRCSGGRREKDHREAQGRDERDIGSPSEHSAGQQPTRGS